MIKVKIYELEKHRNETTFRPYLLAANTLRDIGIEMTRGEDYDFAWVGQASVIDKSLSLTDSARKGIEFCNRIAGPFMIFDGQDSHSLMGTWEVLRETKCKLLLKNTLLRDFNLYKLPTVNGRLYWGVGKYSIPDIDKHKDRIVLSGTNWLSTIPVRFYEYRGIPKSHDVVAVFGHSLVSGSEHGLEHHTYYNAHRRCCLDALATIGGLNIRTLANGERLAPDAYYEAMFNGKIIVAPFGYGEIAPRDIEAAAFGSVLIKPDMSHLITEPNIYDSGTYVACAHNFQDIGEKIEMVLSNYDMYREQMVTNMRAKYLSQYTHERLATHIHNVFTSKLRDIITHDESYN